MKTLKMSAWAIALTLLVSCGNGSADTATGDSATGDTAASMETMAPDSMASTTPATPATVVDVAVASPDHSTLVAAVKAADLAGTLSGAGPFTVFAPTNAAFSALPAGTLDDLLKPENKEKLAGILTYHVVPGAVKSTDLTDGMKAKTVNGKEITITIKDGKVMVNGANVTTADIVAGNGVVHVIDAVILPK